MQQSQQRTIQTEHIYPVSALFLATMFQAAVFASLLITAKSFLPQRYPAAYAAKYAAVDDKLEVSEYFNNEGFNRWNKVTHSPLKSYPLSRIPSDLLRH